MLAEDRTSTVRAAGFSGFVPAADGTQLYVQDRGEGMPALLLCDGIGCAGFAWQNLIEQWAARYRVVQWHYRGHGRSEMPRDATRIGVEDLARDVSSVMNARKVQSAVIVTHSLGSEVALELYRQAPERVQGLVLICGAAGGVTKTFHGTDLLERLLPEARAWLSELPGLTRTLWRAMPSSVAYFLARKLGEIDSTRMSLKHFSMYWEHIRRLDPDLFTQMLQRGGQHNATDILPTINCPTLVFCAERDTFIPPAVVRTMAATIPHAVLVEGKGASHALPVEQPELIDEYMHQIFTPELEHTDTSQSAE